jgi:hypothetical protein
MPVMLTGTLSQAGLGLPGATLVITAPLGWGLSYAPHSLAPGASLVQVTAVLTPPLSVVPATYPVLLMAQLRGGSGLTSNGQANVTVLPQSVSAAITPITRTITSFASFTYTVRVTNTGALPDTFTVAQATDILQGATLLPISTTIDLKPGIGGDVVFTALASPSLVTGTYSVTVRAISGLDTRISAAPSAMFYIARPPTDFGFNAYLPVAIR